MPEKEKRTAMQAMQDEISAMRKDMAMIINQQKQISAQQERIESLMSEIKSLREDKAKQEAKIEFLENRVDDLEQYTRAENLVISGLPTTPMTYSQAASNSEEKNEDASQETNTTIENQVIEFLKTNNITLDPHSVSACHTLGGRQKVKVKEDILQQSIKQLQDSDVYVNEHLTTKNGRLAKLARMLKKDRTTAISKTWTRNGRVYVKWNIPNEEAPQTTRISCDLDFTKCRITPTQLSAACSQLTPRRDPSSRT